MTTTVIDDTGLTRVRLDQRLADLVSALQAIYGSDIDVAPESPDGQLLGIFAEAISDLDQLVEAVYDGRSPSGATGAQLSRLALLNGVIRKGATFSVAPITLTGTPGTVVPMGSLIATTAVPPIIFSTTAALTIGGGGTITGTATALVTGPSQNATSGTLTVIQSVISGWASVTNTADATLGTDVETDAELRVRRHASVALPSQGILDGLFAALAQLDGVRHVVVYENPESTPRTLKGGTLIGHAIQVIIDGGTAIDIANTIWTKKSVGVTQVGAVTQDITDAQGNAQTMKWDTPADVNVYVTVQLSAAVGTPTSDAIKAALVQWGTSNSGIGQDVIWSQLFGPINSVPGLNVVAVFLGSAPSPVLQASLTINFNQIARWDLSRILVTT